MVSEQQASHLCPVAPRVNPEVAHRRSGSNLEARYLGDLGMGCLMLESSEMIPGLIISPARMCSGLCIGGNS